ncbi:MAG: M20/M25/M40 family metallo-hydrolase [Acidimicrobiia bacterium]
MGSRSAGPSTTEAATAIHDWLKTQESRLLDLLEHLVTIESHAASPAGVAAVADTLIEQLDPLSFGFESVSPQPLPAEDHWLEELFSPGVPYEALGPTYVGSAPGSRAGHLLLLGDLDTAFPTGSLERFPFRIEGRRAYGPGIADMKGGLVVMLAALQALHHLGLERPTVTIVLAGDEQAGSLSSRPVIERVGAGANWCFCVECARDGGKLMAGRGHIGVASLAITGLEAHTGSARESGVDALEALAKLVLEFKALSDPQTGTLVTVTIAQAGRRRSVVPALAEATVDVRARSAQAWDTVTSEMHEMATSVGGETGTTITLRTHSHRPGVMWDEHTDSLLATASHLAVPLSIEVEAFESAAAGSSAFADPATTTLDGLGPRGGGLMTPDEHIEIDSVVPRAALLSSLISELRVPPVRHRHR